MTFKRGSYVGFQSVPELHHDTLQQVYWQSSLSQKYSRKSLFTRVQQTLQTSMLVSSISALMF